MSSSEQWRAYLFLLLIGFLETLSFSVVHPVLPLYVESFGVSYDKVGLLFSAYSLTWAAPQVYTGYLADRFGRKRVALIGFAFLSVFALFNYKPAVSPNCSSSASSREWDWDSWAPLSWGWWRALKRREEVSPSTGLPMGQVASWDR